MAISIFFIIFILGIVLGATYQSIFDKFNWIAMIFVWVIGSIFGIFFIGISEIIELLDRISKKGSEYIKPESMQDVIVSDGEDIENEDRDGKSAVFFSRLKDDIQCPYCQKEQKSNRNTCYFCGAKFIYEDESR